MTRVAKIIRFVAALTAFWLVTGADWPMEDVLDILGGIPCC